MRGLWVALGAGIGAPARYLIDQWIKKLHKSAMPLETLLINTLGSFVLGWIIKSQGNVALVIGTGFAGAFTTWSTFALEAHSLFSRRRHGAAWNYLGLTLVLGVAAAALGNSI